MIDPIPQPPGMAAIGKIIGKQFDLDTIHLHLHEIIFAVVFYHNICVRLSPWISAKLFPKTYLNLNARSKLNWDVHVVSLVQSVLINALALYVIAYDEQRKRMDIKERVWGYTGACGLVQALAMGYFFWDFWISVTNIDIFGWGLLAHAVSALYVFALGFRPFVNYYAPSFILYELSSPFLNFHWFFDKLNMTGSNAQLYNGILLMTSFFGSRLVWGPYQSYHVFRDVFYALGDQHTVNGKAWLDAHANWAGVGLIAAPRESAEVMLYAHGRPVPAWYAYTYLGSNAVLTVLNVFWFGKMVETIRKRFDPPFGTRVAEKKEEVKTEPLVGRGLEQDGKKTVEVDTGAVRRRKDVTSQEIPPPQ